MKLLRSGGQAQGILMGTPCAFGRPSQSLEMTISNMIRYLGIEQLTRYRWG